MNVGVIIPTVGRADDLGRCLQSLAAQTVRPGETLVVSASHDDRATAAAVVVHARSVGARAVPGTTRGSPAQRNIGIENLSVAVEVVVFLDDDVVLEPDYVERLVEVLEADPDVRGAGGGPLERPAPGAPWLRAWRRIFLGAPPGRPLLTRGGINLPAATATTPVDADWLSGCAAYRREVVDDLRFDEALEGYALLEDVDFSARARRSGRLVFVPSARLDHRQSAIKRVSAEEFAYQFVRNRWWLIRRHFPGPRSTLAYWWTTAGFALFWAASAARRNELAAARLHGLARGVTAVWKGDLPGHTPRLGDTEQTIAVVVPTVAGREEALGRCLAAVRAQTREPQELCVVRDCSSPTVAVREGFVRTRAEWVAFVDDDAIPQSDWLELLSRHLGEPTVGAVGGRILDFRGGRTVARRYSRGPVASVSWFGRTQSHLHDIPDARIVEDVDFLAGSNMCIRRAALPSIDTKLDDGMAPGFETAICLEMQRRGWRVLFDSEALVTHYPAPRPAHLERGNRERESYEYSYVVTYSLVRNLPWPGKIAFLMYFFLVGQRMSPGLVFAPYFLLPGRARSRFRAAWAGKLRGLREATA